MLQTVYALLVLRADDGDLRHWRELGEAVGLAAGQRLAQAEPLHRLTAVGLEQHGAVRI